jgi:hypothetical protein
MMGRFFLPIGWNKLGLWEDLISLSANSILSLSVSITASPYLLLADKLLPSYMPINNTIAHLLQLGCAKNPITRVLENFAHLPRNTHLSFSVVRVLGLCSFLCPCHEI